MYSAVPKIHLDSKRNVNEPSHNGTYDINNIEICAPDVSKKRHDENVKCGSETIESMKMSNQTEEMAKMTLQKSNEGKRLYLSADHTLNDSPKSAPRNSANLTHPLSDRNYLPKLPTLGDTSAEKVSTLLSFQNCFLH